MGTIQNSVNQMLATSTGAALGAMHVVDQAKQLEIKKIEAEQELHNANVDLAKNTDEIVDKEITEKGYADAEVDADKILTNKESEAMKVYKEKQDDLVRKEVLKDMYSSFQNNMA